MIEFKGKKFELNSEAIAVKMAAAPLMALYTKLEYEYLGDFDTSLLDDYQKRITILEGAIKSVKLQDQNEKAFEGKEQTYGEYLIELQEKLDKVNYEFYHDEKAQTLNIAKKRIEAAMLQELVCHTKEVSKFLDAILIGDKSVIETKGNDYLMFVTEVISNFFLIFLQNENELES